MIRRLRGLMAATGLLLATGCAPERGIMPLEIRRLFVGFAEVPCTNLWGDQVTCLRVREAGGDWQNWSVPIEGFDYVPGYSYEIIVQAIKYEDPPMDGPDTYFRLKRIVKRTPDGIGFVGDR